MVAIKLRTAARRRDGPEAPVVNEGDDATHPPSQLTVSLFLALPLWPTQGPKVGQACYRSFQLSCDCTVARKRPRINVALELAACCLLKALALSHLHAEQFQVGQHLFHGQLIYPTSASVQWRTWPSAKASHERSDEVGNGSEAAMVALIAYPQYEIAKSAAGTKRARIL